MTYVIFHDYPGLEFGLPKSHDFPGPVVTLSLLLCSWMSKFVALECFVFFRFPNDTDRFIFVYVNKTHPLDDRDKIVLFLV